VHGRESSYAIQLDLSERAFVTGHVLLQDADNALLLRTQVNALKLLTSTWVHFAAATCEDEEEIPDVHPHLHAVA